MAPVSSVHSDPDDDWITPQDIGFKVSYDSHPNSTNTLSFHELDYIDECREEDENSSDDDSSVTGQVSSRDELEDYSTRDYDDDENTLVESDEDDEGHRSPSKLRLLDEQVFTTKSGVESVDTPTQRRLYSLHQYDEGELEIRYDGTWVGLVNSLSEELTYSISMEETLTRIQKSLDQNNLQNHLANSQPSEDELPEDSIEVDLSVYAESQSDAEVDSQTKDEELQEKNIGKTSITIDANDDLDTSETSEDHPENETEPKAEIEHHLDARNQVDTSEKPEDQSDNEEPSTEIGDLKRKDVQKTLEQCDLRIQHLESELKKHVLVKESSTETMNSEDSARENELRIELAEAINAARKAESWWKLLDAENAEMQETLWRYHERVQQLEGEALALDLANREVSEKERKVRQEKKIFQNRNAQQRQRLTQLEGALVESSVREDMLKMKIEELENDQIQASEEVEHAKLMAMEKEEALSLIRKELERVNSRARLLQESNEKMKQEKTSLEETILDLEERVRVGQKEMEEMHSQMSQTIQVQMEGHQQKLAQFESHLQELAERESQLLDQLQEAKGEAEEARNDLAAEVEKRKYLIPANKSGIINSFGSILNRTSAGNDFELPNLDQVRFHETTLAKSMPTKEEQAYCFMAIFSLLFQLKYTEHRVQQAETMLQVYDKQLEDDCSDIWDLKRQNKELNEIVLNIEEMKDLLSGQKDILRMKIEQQDRIISCLEDELEEASTKEKKMVADFVRKNAEVESLREFLLVAQTEAKDAEEFYQLGLKTAFEHIAILQEEARKHSQVVKQYQDEMRDDEEYYLKQERTHKQEIVNLQGELDGYKSSLSLLTKELEDKKEEAHVAQSRLRQIEERLEETEEMLCGREKECERIGSLESSVDELHTIIRNLKDERKQLLDKFEAVEAQSRERLQAIVHLECVQEENTVQIGKLQKELVLSGRDLQEFMSRNRRDLGESRRRIESLEEENSQLRKELDQERSRNNARKKAELAESTEQRTRAELRVKQMKQSIQYQFNEIEIARQRVRQAIDK